MFPFFNRKPKQDYILDILLAINMKVTKTMNSIETLKAAVDANTAAVESAVTTISSLSAQLDAAISELKATGDTTALDALAAQLQAEDTKLLAAVAAASGVGSVVATPAVSTPVDQASAPAIAPPPVQDIQAIPEVSNSTGVLDGSTPVAS